MSEEKKTYKAGTYYAVCNNAHFDGHYVCSFYYPSSAAEAGVSPEWWFLNRCDLTACLDKVYPCEIFDTGRIRPR